MFLNFCLISALCFLCKGKHVHLFRNEYNFLWVFFVKFPHCLISTSRMPTLGKIAEKVNLKLKFTEQIFSIFRTSVTKLQADNNSGSAQDYSVLGAFPHIITENKHMEAVYCHITRATLCAFDFNQYRIGVNFDLLSSCSASSQRQALNMYASDVKQDDQMVHKDTSLSFGDLLKLLRPFLLPIRRPECIYRIVFYSRQCPFLWVSAIRALLGYQKRCLLCLDQKWMQRCAATFKQLCTLRGWEWGEGDNSSFQKHFSLSKCTVLWLHIQLSRGFQNNRSVPHCF